MGKNTKANVTVVVGGQWGDEGKGKVVDEIAEKADIVIRAHGGDNAGHSVVNSFGEFALHMIPSGVFYPKVKNIIAGGCVVNPLNLIKELETLENAGVKTSNVFISSQAHLILPYHTLLDGQLESFKGKKAVGTTGRGIGPTYADKALRIGLRAEDLHNPDVILEGIKLALKYHLPGFDDNRKNHDSLKPKALKELAKIIAQKLSHRVIDSSKMIAEFVNKGANVLLEGAQGTYLDIDSVFYPFVTSSSTTVAGVLQGAGIAPGHLTNAIGVFKAIPTRVGSGPFPTEQINDDGNWFREAGQEFGATTGRARRIGYMDLVLLRYSDERNFYDSVFLTKLDLPQGKEVKICEAYELDGKRINRVPDNPKDFERCKPIYMKKIFKLNQDLKTVKRYKDLTDDNKKYVDLFMAQFKKAKLLGIGKGRHRDEVIRP